MEEMKPTLRWLRDASTVEKLMLAAAVAVLVGVVALSAAQAL